MQWALIRPVLLTAFGLPTVIFSRPKNMVDLRQILEVFLSFKDEKLLSPEWLEELRVDWLPAKLMLTGKVNKRNNVVQPEVMLFKCHSPKVKAAAFNYFALYLFIIICSTHHCLL